MFFNGRRAVGMLFAGSLLIGSAADAGEQAVARNRKSAGAPRRILQAQYQVTQPPLPPEPRYNVPDAPPTAATTDPEAPKPIKCPPVGPLTMRPVPAGDGYGRMTCHLSFTGDAHGENWRLQNWAVPKWNMAPHSNRFHLKTHNHSLWAERFWCGMFGKLPNGYVHDTSGWALRSYGTPQPNDPTIPYVQEATAMAYDYPQYVYQPSSCGPVGACPVVPVIKTEPNVPMENPPIQ